MIADELANQWLRIVCVARNDEPVELDSGYPRFERFFVGLDERGFGTGWGSCLGGSSFAMDGSGFRRYR